MYMEQLRKEIRKILLEGFLTQEGGLIDEIKSFEDRFSAMYPASKEIAENWAVRMNNEGAASNVTLDSKELKLNSKGEEIQSDTTFSKLAYAFELLAQAIKLARTPDADGNYTTKTFTMPTTKKEIIVNEDNIIKAIEVCIDPTNKNFITYIKSSGGGKASSFNIDPEMQHSDLFINAARSQITGGIKHSSKKEKFAAASNSSIEDIGDVSIVKSSVYEYINSNMDKPGSSLFMYILNGLRPRILKKYLRDKAKKGSSLSIDDTFGNQTRADKLGTKEDMYGEKVSMKDKIYDIVKLSLKDIINLIKQKSSDRPYAELLEAYATISEENPDIKSQEKNKVLFNNFTGKDEEGNETEKSTSLLANYIKNRALKRFKNIDQSSVGTILKEFKTETLQKLLNDLQGFKEDVISIFRKNGFAPIDKLVEQFGDKFVVKALLDSILGSSTEVLGKAFASYKEPESNIQASNTSDVIDTTDDEKEYLDIPSWVFDADPVDPEGYYKNYLKRQYSTKPKKTSDELYEESMSQDSEGAISSLSDFVNLLTKFATKESNELQEVRKAVRNILSENI